MSRDDLLAFLSRAVRDGLLTVEAAAALLQQYDDGTLDLATLPTLPTADDGTTRGLALYTVAGYLAGGARAYQQRIQRVFERPADVPITSRTEVAVPSAVRRARVSAELQDRFDASVTTAATDLAAGTVTIPEWQLQVEQFIRLHLWQQAVLGGQGVIHCSDLIIESTRQSAYLSRFADQLAIRQAQGAPLSAAAIATRSTLYGGAGRAVFYQAQEAVERDAGYVAQYIAADDISTCSPCSFAEGYYPLSSGPWPGSVCLGRGRCRCERVMVYRPDIAATLR